MSDNRTNEFLSLARTVKSTSRGNELQQQQQTTKTTKNEVRTTFHQQAAGISKDIASTSALLVQLTEKVKHKSLLFEDQDSMVVNTLVVRIKQSIENLNARLDSIQRIVQEQKRASQKSQMMEQTTNVVSGLQQEFAMAASNFKSILQQRTESLKDSDDFKRNMYRNGGEDDVNEAEDDDDIPDMTSHLLQAPPPVFGQHNQSHHPNSSDAANMFPTLDLTSTLMGGMDGGGSVLPRPHGISAGTGNGSSNPMTPLSYNRSSNSAPNTASSYQQLQHLNSMPLSSSNNHYNNNSSTILTPFDIQQMEEESGASQLMQLLPTQPVNYLQTRADAMSAVEANIVELGTIFNKLAGLVSEHSEMVQRVEDNVEDANANVLLSMNVLTDTLTNLKSNKMLAIKLFSILVTFIILFIIFFA